MLVISVRRLGIEGAILALLSAGFDAFSERGLAEPEIYCL